MWKSRPEEKPASPNPPTQPTLNSMGTSLQSPVQAGRSPEPSKSRTEPFHSETAHIGKSVVIKGEVSGSEDLYLDGEVDGNIQLDNHKLVVGPNGRIRADIRAREVVLHGRADGNITGTERVELKRTCVLAGDINTRRIVIEDGAFLKGAVDIAQESKPERPRAAAAAAASAGSGATALTTFSPQPSFLEHG